MPQKLKMPVVYNAELESSFLLVLLAYYYGSRSPNWAAIAQFVNEEVLAANGDVGSITGDALRQKVTKKWMKKELCLKAKAFFGTGGNGHGSAGIMTAESDVVEMPREGESGR